MSITPAMEELLKRTTETIPNAIEVDYLYALALKHSIDINKLLDGSEVVYRLAAADQKAELSELEHMRRRAEERKYQKSIASVSRILLAGKGEKSPFKSASESIAFATHFIFAFASAFLAGYYFAIYGLETESDAIKYMCGGAASFMTLIIEALLFIIREEKQERKSKPQGLPVPLAPVSNLPPPTVKEAPERSSEEQARRRKKNN